MSLTPLRGRTIIVVGEAIDTNELFELFFAACGSTVITTTDPTVALDLAAKQRPHLLLLDVSQEARRVEALRVMAADTSLEPIPIVSTLPFYSVEGKALVRSAGGRIFHCEQWKLDGLLECMLVALSPTRRASDT